MASFFLKNFFLCNRPHFIIVASAVILSFTFILEYFFSIPLCQMCIFERYPYVASILLGITLWRLPFRHSFHQWIKYLLVFTFLISLGLSTYHIGLEHGWFDLPSFCKGSFPKLETIESLREQILNQTTFVPCNMVSLRILGLSLAEWNGVSSFVLLGSACNLLRKK